MSRGRPNCHPSSQRGSLVLIAFLSALICIQFVPLRAAEPKTAEAVEQAFAKEKNYRKRARLALDILDLRLDAIRAFVSTGTMLAESNPVLPAYEDALTRLDQAVREAAHSGTSKQVEVGLRRHMKDLEQIRANVSAEERPLIENIAAHVVKVRETVLYRIMAPKK